MTSRNDNKDSKIVVDLLEYKKKLYNDLEKNNQEKLEQKRKLFRVKLCHEFKEIKASLKNLPESERVEYFKECLKKDLRVKSFYDDWEKKMNLDNIFECLDSFKNYLVLSIV